MAVTGLFLLNLQDWLENQGLRLLQHTATKSLILILLVCYSYAGVYQGEYLAMDEEALILTDPLIQSPQGWQSIWLDPTDNNHAWDYIPITRTSFWLEYQLWGFNASASHIINIVLHLLGAFLFWAILSRLGVPWPWLVALLWAVHPLMVQSVAWITQRRNVLTAIFYLLSLAYYLHGDRKRQEGFYILGLLFFLLALLCKTSSVTLPIVLILARLWQKSPWQKMDALRLLPFFALAIFFATIRIWFEMAQFGANHISYDKSLLDRVLIASWTPWYYLVKFINPFPLSFFYRTWDLSWHDPLTYLYPLLWLSIGLWCSYYWHKGGRNLALTLLAYLATLFPVLGLFANAYQRFSYVANHWVHLALMPLVLALVCGLFQLFQTPYFRKNKWVNRLGLLAVALLIAQFTQWSHQHARHFVREEKLWKQTLKTHPQAWGAYLNLGLWYTKQGEFLVALQKFQEGLVIAPEQAELWLNQGTVYLRLMQFDQALSSLNQAQTLRPDFPTVYFQRGSLLIQLNQYNAAVADFNVGIELAQHNALFRKEIAKAYAHRAFAWTQLKEGDKGLEDWNSAVAHDPQNPLNYTNRAFAWLNARQYEKALLDLDQAVNLQPHQAEHYLNRGIVKAKMGRWHESLEDLKIPLNKNHRNPTALQTRAQVLLELRRWEEALQDVNLILQNEPDFLFAVKLRAEIFHQLRKFTLAVNDLNHLIERQPKEEEHYRKRAASYLELGELELALADLNKAIQWQPTQGINYYNRAIAYIRKKQWTDAQVDLDKLATLQPKQPSVWVLRGEIQRLQNKLPAACQAWKKACDLGDCGPWKNARENQECPGK